MSELIPGPPFRTFLPKKESTARINRYVKYKRSILDAVVNKYNPGQSERDSFYYPDPRLISNFFEEVLNREYTGIRIYFGSCRDTVPTGCDASDRGRLVLIYVPTCGMDDSRERYIDSDLYYILNAKSSTPVSLASSEFNALISNYAEDKCSRLRETLGRGDRNHPKNGKETISVFGDTGVIKEIQEEINYQLKKSCEYGVSGIRVYINSYTHKTVKRDGYRLSRRLTVQFAFTDHTGQDLDLSHIDTRYEVLSAPKLVAFNTFNPTPPYP